MRRYLAVLLVIFLASLSLVSLVTVAHAQAPSLAVSHHATVMVTPEPITVTITMKNSHDSLTPTLLAEGAFTLPTRLKLIGAVFRLGTTDTLHAQPLIIEVRYPPQDALDEKRLMLVYYDPLAEKWLPLKTTMDAIKHVATASAVAQDTIYALVVSPEAVTLPPSAVIVDDLDTTHFTRYGPAGAWHAVTGAADRYYLGHMYWTNNMTPGLTYTENMGIWRPVLSAGAYQVYAFIDWNNATTRNARYQIVHEGQTTIFPLSQYDYVAEWASLGTYTFGADPTRNYVRLDDLTYESSFTKIGFDAMAFVPNKVYLPLIMKPTPPPVMKTKSGMHLGNRSADWPDFLFNYLDGAQPTGAFPAVVVVKSDQLYDIWRGGSICEVGGINPTPRAPTLFAYLKKASAAGTKVIIRINPSPGNFTDWNDPVQPNHHLQAGNTPAGGTYCELSPGSGNWGFMHYRAVPDLAKEIEQIHNLNKSNGWQEYAFEPANEPNTEWYLKEPTAQTAPRIDQSIAWQEMNDYFAALYDAVKALPGGGNIRLLTPPMAQTRYAEPVRVQDIECLPYRLSDNQSSFGYNEMRTVYETKNDGLSWHSYWTYGHEAISPYCDGGDGEHISMTFPDWMLNQITSGAKLGFITETDLASPGQQMGSTLTDKDADPSATRTSIRTFFQNEPAGIYPVMWLLNNNFTDSPGHTENAEINWHQVYTPAMGLIARPWFTTWWTRTDP